MARTKDPNPTGKGMDIENIIDHGTPTQKAYKYLMDYKDRSYEHNDPYITYNESEDILESMSEKDYYYLQAYKLYHATYAELVMRLSLLYEHYLKCGETLKGMYATLKMEEDTLTWVYNNQLSKSTTNMVLDSPILKFEVVQLGGGIRLYYKTENSKWWNKIKEVQKDLNEALDEVVHFVYALDMFDKSYKRDNKGIELPTLRLFRPRVVQRIIKNAKTDKIGKEIPALSRKILHDTMARGEYVSEYDKKYALAPYWEEVKVRAGSVRWWLQQTIDPMFNMVRKTIE